MSEWNDFQHEHAGEGLSSSDMSEMYHEEQDTGDSEGLDCGAGDVVADNDVGSTMAGDASNDFQHEDVQAETEDETTGVETSNPWNDFQHEHAGEGLSPSDMSEMYHEEQDTGDSEGLDCGAGDVIADNDVSSTMAGDASNDFQHEDVQAESEVETTGAETSNSWNKFQHEHAGEGLSPSDMSEMYHEEQDTGDSEGLAKEDSLAATPTAAHTGANLANTGNLGDNTQVENTVEPRPNEDVQQEKENETSGGQTSNSWNEFQQKHAGENLSPSDMSAMYHSQQDSNNGGGSSGDQPERNDATDTNSTTEPPSYETNSTTSAKNDSTTATITDVINTTKNNDWIEFEKANAGKGYNTTQMAEMYNAQKTSLASTSSQSDSTSAAVPTSATQTPQQPDRSVTDDTPSLPQQDVAKNNDWIEFEKANAGKGYNTTQMAEMYNAQKASLASTSSPSDSTSSALPTSVALTPQQPDQSVTDDTPSLPQQDVAKNNDWIEFEKANAGKGYNTTQLAGMYNVQKASQVSGTEANDNKRFELEKESTEEGLSSVELFHLHEFSEYSNDNDKSATEELQQGSGPKPSLTWNQYQHIYGGRGWNQEEITSGYHKFKEEEATFKWGPDDHLEWTEKGYLANLSSPSSREAMKTGLFEDDGRPRRCDQIPYRVYQEKMKALGVTDSSLISASYRNRTGNSDFATPHIRSSGYRRGVTDSENREADHVLELHHFIPELKRTHLPDPSYKVLIEVLNRKDNLESRGKGVHGTKSVINRSMAANKPDFTQPTLEQEKIQSEGARLAAAACREQKDERSAQVCDSIAHKYELMHTIHQQFMSLDTLNENDRQKLLQNVQTYEGLYQRLSFSGGRWTPKHQELLDIAHTS